MLDKCHWASCSRQSISGALGWVMDRGETDVKIKNCISRSMWGSLLHFDIKVSLINPNRDPIERWWMRIMFQANCCGITIWHSCQFLLGGKKPRQLVSGPPTNLLDVSFYKICPLQPPPPNPAFWGQCQVSEDDGKCAHVSFPSQFLRPMSAPPGLQYHNMQIGVDAVAPEEL